MKTFVVALSLVALSCYIFTFTEAAPERQKRSVGQEKCPENTTPEQCIAYAEQKSKSLNYCHRFVGGNGWLEWQTCGRVSCGDNAVLVPEDLSKPYPNCCSTCQILDPSKPVEISGVA